MMYVYMIGQSPDMKGLVKIGVTGNLTARLIGLQTGSPVSLQVIWSVRGDAELEHYLHSAFADHRKHGEWFDLGPDPIGMVTDQIYVRDHPEVRGSVISSKNAYQIIVSRIEELRSQGRVSVGYADFSDLLSHLNRSRGWVYNALSAACDDKILQSVPSSGSRAWEIVSVTDVVSGGGVSES